MTPDQNMRQWASVICIAAGLGAMVLLYFAFLFVQCGEAAIAGRYGGVAFSRKSQPFQFWLIVVLYVCASLFCAYLTYSFYHQFVA